MAHLPELPIELIQNIFLDVSQPDFDALCRTCKCLRAYAEPFLYRSIFLKFGTRECLDNSPIHLLFRTLWERPALSNHIKSLLIKRNEEPFRWDYLQQVPPLEDDRARWLQAAQQLGSPKFQGSLDTAVIEGHVDGLIAVLLSRLHELQILVLDFSVFRECELVGLMLQHAASAPPPYPSSRFLKLREVAFPNDLDSSVMREDDVSVECVFALFHYPALELIDIVLNDPEIIPSANETQSPTLPNLQTLRILDCTAGNANLTSFLSAAPNLQSLDYFFVQGLEELKEDRHYKRGYWNEWEAFTTGLKISSGTLMDLTISADFQFVDDYPPDSMDLDWVNGIWERRGCLGSLRPFVHLERLEVPLCVLLGWDPEQNQRRLQDILPPRLQELYLRDDLVDFGDYLWIPWDKYATRGDQATTSSKTGDPTAVLDLVSEYLPSRSDGGAYTGNYPAPSLTTLCFKLHRDHVWDVKYLRVLERIARGARVACSIHVRVEKWPHRRGSSDQVKEIILYDPLASEPDLGPDSGEGEYKSRYFKEPSRLFRENY